MAHAYARIESFDRVRGLGTLLPLHSQTQTPLVFSSETDFEPNQLVTYSEGVWATNVRTAPTKDASVTSIGIKD
jgi:hypothetical protein